MSHLGGSNRLLTPKEVADRLGIPVSTLYDQWRTWGIPTYRIGRALRFRERDLEAWLSQQLIAA